MYNSGRPSQWPLTGKVDAQPVASWYVRINCPPRTDGCGDMTSDSRSVTPSAAVWGIFGCENGTQLVPTTSTE